jgi:hypothetical protein
LKKIPPKDPSSGFYNDLQFVEPFKYLIADMEEVPPLVYQQLGIQSDAKNIETIQQQSAIASKYFKAYFQAFLGLRKEEMEIMKIITPEELKILSKYRIPEQESNIQESPELATEE